MLKLTQQDQNNDAAIASSLAAVITIVHSALKLGSIKFQWRRKKFRYKSLIRPCFLALVVGVSITLEIVCAVNRNKGPWVVLVWKGLAVLSLWSFELDFLLTTRNAKIVRRLNPFWTLLFFQVFILGSFGAWLLVDHGIEVLWVLPAVSHVNFVMIGCYGFIELRREAQQGPPQREALMPVLSSLRLSIAIGVASTFVSVVLCVISTVLIGYSATSQCLACMPVVVRIAERDWRAMKKRDAIPTQESAADDGTKSTRATISSSHTRGSSGNGGSHFDL
ncbi:Fc.00g056240.m01.CDS01 [Cosmosporella sp. VM-42]